MHSTHEDSESVWRTPGGFDVATCALDPEAESPATTVIAILGHDGEDIIESASATFLAGTSGEQRRIGSAAMLFFCIHQGRAAPEWPVTSQAGEVLVDGRRSRQLAVGLDKAELGRQMLLPLEDESHDLAQRGRKSARPRRATLKKALNGYARLGPDDIASAHWMARSRIPPMEYGELSREDLRYVINTANRHRNPTRRGG